MMTAILIAMLAVALFPFFVTDGEGTATLPAASADDRPSFESIADSAIAEHVGSGNVTAPPPAAAENSAHPAAAANDQPTHAGQPDSNWIADVPPEIAQTLRALGYQLDPQRSAWLAALPPEQRTAALRSFSEHLQDWYSKNYTPHAEALRNRYVDLQQREQQITQFMDTPAGRLANQLAGDPELLAYVQSVLRGETDPNAQGAPRNTQRPADDPAMRRLEMLENELRNRDQRAEQQHFQQTRTAWESSLTGVVREVSNALGFNLQQYPGEYGRAMRYASAEISHMKQLAEQAGHRFNPTPDEVREILLDSIEHAGFMHLYNDRQQQRATIPAPPNGQARPAAEPPPNSLEAALDESLKELKISV